MAAVAGPAGRRLCDRHGRGATVREFVEHAARAVGLNLQWQGKADKEIGIDRASGRELVKIDPRYFRPHELDATIGNPAKAREKLGWSAEVKFAELVKLMVEADLAVVAANAR